MNAERLHLIVRNIKAEIDDTGLVKKIQNLTAALQNVVKQQQEPHQTKLGQELDSVIDALTDVPSDYFSPAWRQIVSEIGCDELIGQGLLTIIQEIFSRNQITYAIALDEVKEIQNDLTKFNDAISKIVTAFPAINIGSEELAPGECELGILIPRAAVNNNLELFGKELKELNFIFGTLSEVATGKRDDFEITTISSSDLVVYLIANPEVAACIAIGVERIITIYKKLLEIKKLKKELAEQGVSDDELRGIDDHATQKMEVGIEEITNDIIVDFYQGKDGGRKNELANGVRVSLRNIASRIDRGYNIEVRAEPLPEDADGEEAVDDNELIRQQISVVLKAQKSLEFMHLEGPPILHLPEISEESKQKK